MPRPENDRIEEMRERITMTFLDVRQLEGKVTRLDGRVERLESKVDVQRRRLDELMGKVDMIIRHFGIAEK